MNFYAKLVFAAVILSLLSPALPAHSQVVGASLHGVVTDTSKAAVSGASVVVRDLDTGNTRTITTDAHGRYTAPSVPVGHYAFTVRRDGFATQQKSGITLVVGQKWTSHSAFNRSASRSSSVLRLPALISPRRKVFSNQLPSNAVQSLEVIDGAPSAEYGDKTSLVIVATTRSGQDITTPTGSIRSSYGSFGSSTASFDLSYGQRNWGNFIEVDGLNTGRFLDPPEFVVFHSKGNPGTGSDAVSKMGPPKKR